MHGHNIDRNYGCDVAIHLDGGVYFGVYVCTVHTYVLCRMCTFHTPFSECTARKAEQGYDLYTYTPV